MAQALLRIISDCRPGIIGMMLLPSAFSCNGRVAFGRSSPQVASCPSQSPPTLRALRLPLVVIRPCIGAPPGADILGATEQNRIKAQQRPKAPKGGPRAAQAPFGGRCVDWLCFVYVCLRFV